MLDRSEVIRLPYDVFRLLRDLVSEYCGIYFDDDSRYLVEKRLSRRVKTHNFDNFRDYYRFLLYDRRREEELAAIIDILTVNETYFFREKNQLRAFIDEICVELRALKRDSRKLRIWSAGCSSGEEPYTIAMLILDRPELFADWDVEIIGSDINQRVLQVARKGFYRKGSFRATDDRYTREYFQEHDGGYTIKDEVKKFVSFSCLNLLDPFKSRFLPAMDVVFCRNVLIYFHPEAKRKVIDTFYHRLSYGGYLLLGHAESLMNVSTSFSLKHLKNDMVYQKPKKTFVSISDETLFSMVWKR
jgi:chemotaxis protein methyltransferase CheR